MSKIIKTTNPNVFKVIFDRKPKAHDDTYECILSKEQKLPTTINVNECWTDNEFVKFPLHTYKDIALYSVVNFMTVPDTFFDHFHSGFTHYYQMPILYQRDNMIKTKTTTIKWLKNLSL
jgi:hypothetical protein